MVYYVVTLTRDRGFPNLLFSRVMNAFSYSRIMLSEWKRIKQRTVHASMGAADKFHKLNSPRFPLELPPGLGILP